jgi:hypothetical protein
MLTTGNLAARDRVCLFLMDYPARTRLRILGHATVKDLPEAIGRIRGYIAAAGIGGHYAKYPDLAFEDWPTAYYGRGNYARIESLKKLYDPDDRFRLPQSVRRPG